MTAAGELPALQAHAAAREYIEHRQWAPIPVPYRSKMPVFEGWPLLRLTVDTVLTHFPKGRRWNIAVLNGQPSGNLLNMDLDSPEAIALAPDFLPPTPCRYGRKSKPESHWLYVAQPLVKTTKFEDVDGTMLAELLSTGTATPVPPSVNPSGEAVEWSSPGEPARVNPTELLRAGSLLAATALLARHWPGKGTRHHAALAVAGFLLRAGLDEATSMKIVSHAARFAADEEWQQRAENVRSTAAKLAADEPVTGGPTLADCLIGDGEKVVTRLRRWLGADSKPGNLDLGRLLDAITGFGESPDPVALIRPLRAFATALLGVDRLTREAWRTKAVTDLNLLKLTKAQAEALLNEALADVQRDQPGDSGQGQVITFTDADPWPEPVDGPQLLDDITGLIERFIVIAPEAARAVALWVLLTYVFDAFDIVPILTVQSPTKRCGKTRLMRILRALVRRAFMTSNMSPAVAFRLIERHAVTLLTDEFDSFAHLHEELRNIFNAGHDRAGAVVALCVGDDPEPHIFSVWAPKAIALIGRLPDTILDRSLVIPMQRKARSEYRERLRARQLEALAEPLRQRTVRWAQDSLEHLRTAEPTVPEELDDRAADNWTPSLAIADLCGSSWPELARKAALTLSGPPPEEEGESSDQDEPLNVLLLADVREIYAELRQGKAVAPTTITTEDLIRRLTARDDRPWQMLKSGPLTAYTLRTFLRPFKIKSVQIHPANRKGYRFASFRDAWARYVPDPGSAREPRQPSPSPDLPTMDANDANTPYQTSNLALSVHPNGQSARSDEESLGTSRFSEPRSDRSYAETQTRRSEETRTSWESSDDIARAAEEPDQPGVLEEPTAIDAAEGLTAAAPAKRRDALRPPAGVVEETNYTEWLKREAAASGGLETR